MIRKACGCKAQEDRTLQPIRIRFSGVGKPHFSFLFWISITWTTTLSLSMPPRRQDDIMDVNSEESDASLDYDEPRRKGKGKAPKKKDKGKNKVTEVSVTHGRLKPIMGPSPWDEHSRERLRLPMHGRHPTLGLGIQSRRMNLEAFRLQWTTSLPVDVAKGAILVVSGDSPG